MRPIKLHRSDIDAHGVLNIWRIYKTEAARRRGLAQFKRRWPMLDYVQTCGDTQGFGLQLTRDHVAMAASLPLEVLQGVAKRRQDEEWSKACHRQRAKMFGGAR